MPNGVYTPHHPPSFCLVLKIPHEATPMTQREAHVFKYLFIQLETTKDWSDSTAAISLADIRRTDERSADDEETFRLHASPHPE